MQTVCVQGLGFVGAAMAAALAQARDRNGEPNFIIYGVDLPNSQGKDRIEAVNAGRFPFMNTDPHLREAIRCGREWGNLAATVDPAVFGESDVVIVDVHLDADFNLDPPKAELEGFKQAIRTIGDHIRPGALVVVETTVPPGTTELIVVPELRARLAARRIDPDRVLVAHSFERVTPGRNYLASITGMWRVYAGATDEAAEACRLFLEKFIDTAVFPPTRLSRPIESETAKLMENSFRAANIAFIEEWARFAERAGVNLGAVIEAIRVRPTHRNMMRPGFGVGGYCLTKDPLLAGIGSRDILGLHELSFPVSEAAVRINERMPLATLELLSTSLGGLRGRRILLLGAAYREDVGDTRFSPSAWFIVCAEAEGALIDVHDPLVEIFDEIDRPVSRVLSSLDGYDAAVFAVAHSEYRSLAPCDWLKKDKPLIVDANMVLSGEQLQGFQQAGCRVKVIGRGDL